MVAQSVPGNSAARPEVDSARSRKACEGVKGSGGPFWEPLGTNGEGDWAFGLQCRQVESPNRTGSARCSTVNASADVRRSRRFRKIAKLYRQLATMYGEGVDELEEGEMEVIEADDDSEGEMEE